MITLFALLIGSHYLYCQHDTSFTTEVELLRKMTIEGTVGASAGYSIDGNLYWRGSNGWKDKKAESPFEVNTKTRIASIAKPMTATAIMQLVERNMIELDAPVQTYLPDFPKKKKDPITIRHLLAHTSGLKGYKNAKEAENQKQYNSLWDATEVFMNRKRSFTPGSEFEYTTYGYVVLGAIIEEVSGLSFENYMQQNIWNIANMANTGVEHIDQELSNKSLLYHFDKGQAKNRKPNNLSNRTPGGGFYSTVEDIIKFGNAMLRNELINEESFAEMMKIQGVQKKGNPYGFGWFLYGPTPNENVIVGHTGAQTGCSSVLFFRSGDKYGSSCPGQYLRKIRRSLSNCESPAQPGQKPCELIG